MIKNYTFKTQRGASAELTIEIENIKTKTINLDGHECEVNTDDYKYSVKSITVNGKSYNGVLVKCNTEIQVGMHGNQPILVALPKEITADFTAEETAKAEIRRLENDKIESDYQKHRAMMARAMREF